ncbi:chemotaxis protein CheA [Methylophilus methylotrophus]|uniref:chemotaxis protein CheA n=1 Tax=Methylophilus methylotrophus TaxID=17 RepID=UPI000F59774E|nr:chemotaxis protein CheA [Methylophilus methylotrophus]
MQLDESLQIYIIESRDLLQQMEEALLTLEQNPEDEEKINAIFRAAHTIKGSAGLFGLDFIISFTHVAESVLDKVRNGQVPVTEEIVALFLEVGDFISKLIDHVAEGTTPDADTLVVNDGLINRLNVYLGTPSATAAALPVASQNEASGVVESLDGVETSCWHISLRFGPDTFRSGMDPFSFLRYMNTMGKIVHVATITQALPPLEEMDAESCYLGFEISYESQASKVEIESIFDFVRDDCDIHILPPHSQVQHYIDLIDRLSNEEMKLGEILVKCGTLTPTELETALAKQADVAAVDKQPIGQTLVNEQLVQPAVVNAALEKQRQVKETKNSESNFIRIDANKLDELINLVGELIIAGAGATLIADRIGDSAMNEATSNIATLVEQVRDSALALRMVQIGATFSRFNRVVRDVSKELGKDIRLEISGEETELDKTVVEKISDPLTHLVRNSMDHGIESAEARVAKGKPAYGTLKLNAFHDSGSIVIEVSDDGAGLNRDKILAKAIDKGLVSAEQSLSDKDIYNLIFEAGFSTADAVSNLSGRGVGMDVVKRNIQALRGTIDIQSTPGLGCTMSIRLPLTLAIIDGFLVGVADSSYVVPLDMVVECIELSAEDYASSVSDKRNFINLRGEVLPYLKLRDEFECKGEPPTRQNIVVMQYANQKIGLVVDKLIGEFQTVIKPLGKVFEHVKGIGGFTILGSGSVALVLDVPRMMQLANMESIKEQALIEE